MIDYENLDLLTYKKQKNLEKFGRTKSCLRNNSAHGESGTEFSMGWRMDLFFPPHGDYIFNSAH